MTKYIAVAPATELVNLKRYLIMFDQIAVVTESPDEGFEPCLSADLEWLRNQGILVLLRRGALNWKVINFKGKGDEGPGRTLKVMTVQFLQEGETSKDGKSPKQFWTAFGHPPDKPISSTFVQRHVRFAVCDIVADRMNAGSNSRVIPIVPSDKPHAIIGRPCYRGEVLRVLMNEMPEPSLETSLDRILQFRADPESRSKIIAFRHWIQKMVKEELPPNEVVEELEYLKTQYEQHMKLYGMKINLGVWETVLTIAGEAAENLIKVKWTNLAKAPFVLSHRKIDLLEAESKAPGREISYWVHLNREFRS